MFTNPGHGPGAASPTPRPSFWTFAGGTSSGSALDPWAQYLADNRPRPQGDASSRAPAPAAPGPCQPGGLHQGPPGNLAFGPQPQGLAPGNLSSGAQPQYGGGMPGFPANGAFQHPGHCQFPCLAPQPGQP